MTEPNSIIGPFTDAEQRRADLNVKDNAMYIQGSGHPNYPGGPIDTERERREEELHADATLLMELARRISELQTWIATLTPTSNQGVDATAVAAAFAEEFHNSVEEDAREMSPEAVRDWCRAQAAKGIDGFMDGIHKMA